MLISGRCHCGKIFFALDWRPEPSEIAARACTCSFCAKREAWRCLDLVPDRIAHGDRQGSHARIKIRVRHQDCRVSRVHRVWRGARIDGCLYAVVSVNAFENVEPALLRRAPATFEGESEQARLSRRKRNWIADVRFEATS